MDKQPVIVGVTGHRKLNHSKDKVKEVVREKLHQLQADAVVTGMALGFDMLVAEVCVEEGIPFIAAVPCRGQTKRWPPHEKSRWIGLMEQAYKHKVVTPGEFQIWKLLERNKWIVKRSNFLLAYWDGHPKGGTYHCVTHAEKVGRLKENIYQYCAE